MVAGATAQAQLGAAAEVRPGLAAGARGLFRGVSRLSWVPLGRHLSPKSKTDPFGQGSKQMVPFWERCTTHFSLF